jgi:hypothetical protein
MPSSKEVPSKTKQDYEELGRRLENIYLTGYISKKEMFKWGFLKGLITGFGGVIGATIVVGLLLWIFTVLGHVPLIGPLVKDVKSTVETKKD